MRISPIKYSVNSQSQIKKKEQVLSSQPANRSFCPSFLGGNILFEYLYNKSLILHRNEAKQMDLGLASRLFNEQFKVPFDLSGVSEAAAKVISYCCFYTAQIFRQLKQPLPTMIGVDRMPSHTLACCYYTNGRFPIRAVLFNSLHDWENAIKNATITSNNDGFHSSYHFLSTAIHEFAHNVHFHHLYSKFGSPNPAPGYIYNPNVHSLMAKLNMPLYDKNGNPVHNPFISSYVRNTMKDSSGYGSTLLPELFAEEFTRAVVNNLDPMSLTLKRNPFPITTSNRDLYQVLYETWEGLIGDGKGLI